jgi:hypothetical protein
LNAEFNYQIYIEYGTMRQIKLNMQETITAVSAATPSYSVTETPVGKVFVEFQASPIIQDSKIELPRY